MQTLCRQLRRRRLELGLSARRLADKVGVTDTCTRAIERGDRAPSPGVTQDIVEALGAETTTPSDPRLDLAWRIGDQKVVVEFKHYTGNAATTHTLGRTFEFLQTQAIGAAFVGKIRA